MDVGLNNTNKLGEINPAFKDVVFLVEATSSERHSLWVEHAHNSPTNIQPLSEKELNEICSSLSEKPKLAEKLKALNIRINGAKRTRVNWEEISQGFALEIGKIEKKSVVLTFFFAKLDGHKVAFYNCSSQAVDYAMIKDWLIERFQLTNDNYHRWNHTDAMNFHNCLNSLDSLDKEPRNTVYKKG